MSELFASGHIVDLIIVFTAIEVTAVVAYRRRTGRGLPSGDLISTLLSGICLMIALRCALTGLWWGWIGLCLGLALVAHLNDLARRWR